MRIVTWVLVPARPGLVCVATSQHRASPPGHAVPSGNSSQRYSAEMERQCDQSSFIMLTPIIAGLIEAHCEVDEFCSRLLLRGTP